MYFETNYEVGVSSVVINQSWSTVKATFIKFAVYQNNLLVPQYFKSEIFYSNYYSSAKEIIKDMNIYCEKYFNLIIKSIQSV